MNAITPRQFTSGIKTAIEEAKEKGRSKSLLRSKINESIDNVLRIKSGVELHDIVKSFTDMANKQIKDAEKKPNASSELARAKALF